MRRKERWKEYLIDEGEIGLGGDVSRSAVFLEVIVTLRLDVAVQEGHVVDERVSVLAAAEHGEVFDVLCSHFHEGFTRPSEEPINGAARNETREAERARAERLTNRAHAQHYVEIGAGALYEVRVELLLRIDFSLSCQEGVGLENYETKKPKSTLLADNTRVDNKKTNKAQASRLCSTDRIPPLHHSRGGGRK